MNATLELNDPIEAGQTYRWGNHQFPVVEIRDIFITEDGETEIRIYEANPEGATARTIDAEGFFERVADGRLELI